MKRIKRLEPVNIMVGGEKRTYYPIGTSTLKERALEEARLFRRLGYKAQVREYQYPHLAPIVHYAVLVGKASLWRLKF